MQCLVGVLFRFGVRNCQTVTYVYFTVTGVQACAKRELVGGAKVKCPKSEVTSEVTWECHLGRSY